MSDVRIEVWTHPADPGGFVKLCEPPVLDGTGWGDDLHDIDQGVLVTWADYEHLDLILSHDPTDVGAASSSLIRGFMRIGGTWTVVYEWFADETQMSVSADGRTISIPGPDVRSLPDDGVVYPRTPTDPHWQWGAPTLTKNADLFEGTVADEEIKLWTTASSGSFTVDVESSGTPATINVGDTAGAVKTALEGLTTVNEVQVGGSGTATDPWHVIFTDPGKTNVFIQTNDAGLTGGSSFLQVVVEGGQIVPAYYMKSQTIDGVEFGIHGGGSHAVVEDPLIPGGRALYIAGRTPFIGTQQFLEVDLDSIGYATAEIIPANGTEEYRLVVRDINGGFVGSSGGSGGFEGITLTPNQWNFVTTGMLKIEPDDGDRIIVRAAVVSEGVPGNFWIKNLKFHPGFPATTWGDIMQVLNDHAQAQGDLATLDLSSFSATSDSDAVVWDTAQMAFQADAGMELGTHVQRDGQVAGYEHDVIPLDPPAGGKTHQLMAYNPGGRGQVAGTHPAMVLGSLIAAQFSKRRVPYTHLLVETNEEEFAVVTDVRLAGLPRRTRFVRMEWAHDVATATQGAAAIFDREIDALMSVTVTLSGETVVPYRDFDVGWTIPYTLGKHAPKHARRVQRIGAARRDGRWEWEVTA